MVAFHMDKKGFEKDFTLHFLLSIGIDITEVCVLPPGLAMESLEHLMQL